jgi:oligoribonuclease NrnB/cAMP/cGMP phosphodiesterase (DHH superfamily)
MKCYYHNDLDGRCSAAIVYKYMKDSKLKDYEEHNYIEVNYDSIIDVDSIKKGEKVIIVDFSFKPEVMEEVLNKTKNVVWIDHHKTAVEYKYIRRIDGLRIVEDKKYAGCELTWMYFFKDTEMPMAVKYIGDYDKWAHKYGKASENFVNGMLLEEIDFTSLRSIWDILLHVNKNAYSICVSIGAKGNTCSKYRDVICDEYCKANGFELDFEGYKCYALGLYYFGSKTFGYRFDKYDVCISFEYTGKDWKVGLYSEKVDVSEIAKKYGGGGHTGAAGFICKELPFIK